MKETLTLYHGSPMIVDHPEMSKSNTTADFGPGFYMALSEETAMEWACANETDGYANQYTLDTTNLTTLDLTSKTYNIMNWFAVVLYNRKFPLTSDEARESRDYVIDNFLPKFERKDIVIGYRADNTYFAFANAFLNNEISVEEFRKAMKLGPDGVEVMIRTKKAMDTLQFISSSPADKSIYYPKILAKDSQAREELKKIKGVTKRGRTVVYLFDIIGERMDGDDPRIRGRILK